MHQDSGDTERDQLPFNPHGSTGALLELPESPHSQLVNFFKGEEIIIWFMESYKEF